MSEPVLLERDGAVATIVLNRPDKLNALDYRLAEAFRSAVLDVERDEAVRCVVVRGAGRGFMAGGDVAGFHAELGPGIAGHVGRLIDLKNRKLAG